MASLADGSLPQTSSDYSTVSMNQGPTGNTSSAPQFGRQTAKAEMQARLRNQNAAVLARGKTPIVPTPALPAIVSSRAGRAVMPNPTQASASPLTQRQTQSAANADVPTGQVPIPLTAPSEKQRKVQVVNDLMLDALGECYREMRLHSRARLIGKGACGYVYSVESSGADLANRALCLKIFITEPHIAKAEYDLLRYAHALIKLGTPASVPQPYKFRHITEPACKGVVHAILMERIDDHAPLSGFKNWWKQTSYEHSHAASVTIRQQVYRAISKTLGVFRRYGLVLADLQHDNILINRKDYKVVFIDFGMSGYFPALHLGPVARNLPLPEAVSIWPSPNPFRLSVPNTVREYMYTSAVHICDSIVCSFPNFPNSMPPQMSHQLQRQLSEDFLRELTGDSVTLDHLGAGHVLMQTIKPPLTVQPMQALIVTDGSMTSAKTLMRRYQKMATAAFRECAKEMSLKPECQQLGRGSSGFVYAVFPKNPSAFHSKPLCLKFLVGTKEMAQSEYEHMNDAFHLYEKNNGGIARVPQPFGEGPRHVKDPACQGLIHCILMERIDNAKTLRHLILHQWCHEAFTPASLTIRRQLVQKIDKTVLVWKDHGLVHADLNYGNLMVKDNELVVIDFGLSAYFASLNRDKVAQGAPSTSTWVWADWADASKRAIEPTNAADYLRVSALDLAKLRPFAFLFDGFAYKFGNVTRDLRSDCEANSKAADQARNELQATFLNAFKSETSDYYMYQLAEHARHIRTHHWDRYMCDAVPTHQVHP